MKKIGLLFSGSGSNDGSEIQEAVLTMLELDRRECEVVAMAPNIDQMHVVNHYTDQEMDEYRNVLVESSSCLSIGTHGFPQKPCNILFQLQTKH